MGNPSGSPGADLSSLSRGILSLNGGAFRHYHPARATTVHGSLLDSAMYVDVCPRASSQSTPMNHRAPISVEDLPWILCAVAAAAGPGVERGIAVGGGAQSLQWRSGQGPGDLQAAGDRFPAGFHRPTLRQLEWTYPEMLEYGRACLLADRLSRLPPAPGSSADSGGTTRVGGSITPPPERYQNR